MLSVCKQNKKLRTRTGRCCEALNPQGAAAATQAAKRANKLNIEREFTGLGDNKHVGEDTDGQQNPEPPTRVRILLS